MTDREKAIIMAYTGVCTLKGDKMDEFYKYVASLYGRPVYTHEMLMLEGEIKELAREDFIALCAGDEAPYEQRLQREMIEVFKIMSERNLLTARVRFRDGIKMDCMVDLSEWHGKQKGGKHGKGV